MPRKPEWKEVYDAMAVDLPEGHLDGVTVSKFEVVGGSIDYCIHVMRSDGRAAHPGVYTMLTRDGQLWMSDTTAERRDHLEPLYQMWQRDARRVLVNGLGLGMIVKAALTLPSVEHIDVVEIDPRVAKLVGSHYEETGRVSVIVGDAFDQAQLWPRNTRWDVGWSDIWSEQSENHLWDMARLNRSYGQRCDWHECWGQAEIRRHMRQWS